MTYNFNKLHKVFSFMMGRERYETEKNVKEEGGRKRIRENKIIEKRGMEKN